MGRKTPAAALLAPVPKQHLDDVERDGMTTVIFGSNDAGLFWSAASRAVRRADLYESLDPHRPEGESKVRWAGRFSRSFPHEELTQADDKRRPPQTRRGDTAFTMYWEAESLRKLSDDEAFPISDLTKEDGTSLSPALIPIGPTPKSLGSTRGVVTLKTSPNILPARRHDDSEQCDDDFTFHNDDDGFRDWLAAHPADGYVLRSRRKDRNPPSG